MSIKVGQTGLSKSTVEEYLGKVNKCLDLFMKLGSRPALGWALGVKRQQTSLFIHEKPGRKRDQDRRQAVNRADTILELRPELA